MRPGAPYSAAEFPLPALHLPLHTAHAVVELGRVELDGVPGGTSEGRALAELTDRDAGYPRTARRTAEVIHGRVIQEAAG